MASGSHVHEDLELRLAALEGGTPPPPPPPLPVTGVLELRQGATWTDLLNAWANVDPTDIVLLPDGPIIQEAAWELTGKPIRLFPKTPNSALKLLSDVSLYGSNMQISMHHVSGVEFGAFTIEQDRAGCTRTLGLSIADGANNIFMYRPHFKNITNDCIIVRPDANSIASDANLAVHDVHVIEPFFDEWYESAFNIREGSCRRIWVTGGGGTTHLGNPDTSVSRPSGLIVNLENSTGLVEDVIFSSVQLNCYLPNNGNCMGLVMQWEGSGFSQKYNRVVYHNNEMSGWNIGSRTTIVHGGTAFPGPATVCYLGNKFRFTNGPGMLVENPQGTNQDHLILASNEVYQYESHEPYVFSNSNGINIHSIGNLTL